MTLFDNSIPEADVTITALENIVVNSGRNVIENGVNRFWIDGNDVTSILIGHVKDKKSITIFAGRPLPADITEVECAYIANRLNADSDIVRFYVRFSERANRYVLFVDHYIFYTDALIKSHFLTSLKYVEYFSMEFDIKLHLTHIKTLN